MSHLPERKEKACLNCGAAIHGRFCHVCGQENIEPKESFWHLITHFMYDITHFDGKFFSTLQYLLFRPGFLSHEYLRGRRASYLHPIRMYVFTSAFFFLIFFSLHKEDEVTKVNINKPTAAQLLHKLEKKKTSLVKDTTEEEMPLIAKRSLIAAIAATDSDIALIKRDTTAKDKLKTLDDSFSMLSFSTDNLTYKSLDAYDSVQKQLPAAKRDNFIERRFSRQNIHLKEKYNGDEKAIWIAILSKFKHFFPQMLFVSLPLFALLLQLLYVRRKNFFYVNHVVFTIHLYCATFIIILANIAIESLWNIFGKYPDWMGGLFVLAGFFYWYKALRNFYEQRRGKTILKYFLVLLLSIFIMAFLFTLFFIFSAMAI